MRTITVKPILSEEQVKKLEGEFIDESYIKQIVDTDTKVLNEKGEPLLVFKKNCIPSNHCKMAYPVFKKAIGKTSNRGKAGGKHNFKVGDIVDGSVVGKVLSGNRFVPLKKDGTLSNSPKSKNVNSSIIGYADRYPRIPYCRQTAFTEKHFDMYSQAIPYLQSISKLFEEFLPERWKNQKKEWDKTSEDFKIHGTVFTTITVNKNFRTACHYDAGDLKEGFGNLAVLQTGEYEGAYTVIPKYGVAVDVRNCDIAFFDVHELHGNTATISKKPYERISIICYYRKKMIDCGTATEELERIKNAR